MSEQVQKPEISVGSNMKTIIGGKDSQVVLSLALAAGHNPVCVHQNTGNERRTAKNIALSTKSGKTGR